ncbi:MAG: response regulator [Chloroflexi bacterium]|nr:response regulator [Chloroflexota bacterium]
MATILVVDDDPDFLEFTRIVLESRGHGVLTATDGETGLALARAARPDLAILDILISYSLTGLSLLQEMRADPTIASMPVLVVTSIARSKAVESLIPDFQAFASVILAKPLDPNELLAHVEASLAKRGQGWLSQSQSTTV